MKITIDNNKFISVKCIKDNNMYVYNILKYPYFMEEDYTLIKCSPVINGNPDFAQEVEIYGKDLVCPNSEQDKLYKAFFNVM
jgi:hypothetical protein